MPIRGIRNSNVSHSIRNRPGEASPSDATHQALASTESPDPLTLNTDYGRLLRARMRARSMPADSRLTSPLPDIMEQPASGGQSLPTSRLACCGSQGLEVPEVSGNPFQAEVSWGPESPPGSPGSSDLLSPASARRLGGAFEVVTLEPLVLKPVPAWFDSRLTSENLEQTKPRLRSADKINKEDIPIAGYLLARQADRRPLDDLKAILNAHDGKIEARNLLPYGRGNVVEDILATSFYSLWGVFQARGTQKTLNTQLVTGEAELATGAGNCQEHATLAALSIASRMGPGAKARIAHDGAHFWAEHAPDGDFTNRESVAVSDPWKSGPAILAVDSADASKEGVKTAWLDGFWEKELTRELHGYVLDRAKRSAAKRNADGRLPLPHPRLEGTLDYSNPLFFFATSGVRDDFARRARLSIHQEVSPHEAYAAAKPKGDHQEEAVGGAGEPTPHEVREAEETQRPVPARVRSSIQAFGVARRLAPEMKKQDVIDVVPKIVEAARNLMWVDASHAVHPLDDVPKRGHDESVSPP